MVAFHIIAEIAAQYLSKGSRVYIEGRQQRQWEDQSGQRRYTTEIVANDPIMLDGRLGQVAPVGADQNPGQPDAL